MGFRKLHEFNLSMLGKQAWKLIQEPNSLMTRLLKARYFPIGCFFQASIGHNPSYTWRSLLQHPRSLEAGHKMEGWWWSFYLHMGWANWIRGDNPVRLLNPAGGEELANLIVSDLIDPCWSAALEWAIYSVLLHSWSGKSNLDLSTPHLETTDADSIIWDNLRSST